MKIGDLVVDHEGQLGIVLTEPRLCADCEPGGEAYEAGEGAYYLVDVQMSTHVECVATDEVETVNENW
jgi:hypothetical protein